MLNYSASGKLHVVLVGAKLATMAVAIKLAKKICGSGGYIVAPASKTAVGEDRLPTPMELLDIRGSLC